MIGTIDISVNAQHPNMPLPMLFAFVGSPSQVRILNVPKKIGNWKIEKVFVTANYPDNSNPSVQCQMTGSAWHGTLPKSDSVGKSINGFTITASGIDENGNEVEGYILGKGDVGILNTDGTITVGETTYYLHFLPTKPETPHLADVIFEDEQWKIWNGTEWTHFGGGDYLPIVGGTLDSGTEFPTNLNVGQNSIGVITVKGTNVNQTLLGNQTEISSTTIYKMNADGSVSSDVFYNKSQTSSDTQIASKFTDTDNKISTLSSNTYTKTETNTKFVSKDTSSQVIAAADGSATLDFGVSDPIEIKHSNGTNEIDIGSLKLYSSAATNSMTMFDNNVVNFFAGDWSSDVFPLKSEYAATSADFDNRINTVDGEVQAALGNAAEAKQIANTAIAKADTISADVGTLSTNLGTVSATAQTAYTTANAASTKADTISSNTYTKTQSDGRYLQKTGVQSIAKASGVAELDVGSIKVRDTDEGGVGYIEVAGKKVVKTEIGNVDSDVFPLKDAVDMHFSSLDGQIMSMQGQVGYIDQHLSELDGDVYHKATADSRFANVSTIIQPESIADVYLSSKPYALNEVAMYQGQLYECISSTVSGVAPSDTGHWKKTSACDNEIAVMLNGNGRLEIRDVETGKAEHIEAYKIAQLSSLNVVLKDATFNEVTLSNNMNIYLPQKMSGYARDFTLILNVPSSFLTSWTYSLPAVSAEPWGDANLSSVQTSGTYRISYTETRQDRFELHIDRA